MTNDQLKALLGKAQTIAVVGHSDSPHRTSYQIAQYLRRVGYKIYAVNPTVASIEGTPVYASLADIPVPIDIVNVFRRSEHLLGVVDEAIEVGAGAVWAQLGVADRAASLRAQEAGLPIIMDACIKVVHSQLLG